ncbi:N-acetylmuramoyl-L-alanine amidase [Ktedonosporobacter rubrisoli]|uniref:N-acetylmuramoyl-L-alanine amidase n=1 Tax=Ktedonosporobacter rubrisoli TaxID=2509675 RepID=A0A4P6JNK4_KTERU|nr:N-acetylmuramoyl-L-alanine amidase [Ktedonosporobacter rubrisoli]QBD76690.1 N-acetylmuramoyl-L-alanine amidase [Ktedonosporobacter rubrisoli]
MRRVFVVLKTVKPVILFASVGALLLLSALGVWNVAGRAHAAPSGDAEQVFAQASQETGVPSDLLKAICQMEGHMHMHSGSPNIGDGYGCMNLVHTDADGCQAQLSNAGLPCTHHFTRRQINTLDHAAQLMHVSQEQIKSDFATNIRAGAWILREDAQKASSSHSLPTNLADWYGAVAAYSNATVSSTATMYADAVYKLIQNGFTATTDQGATVSLQAQAVTPHRQTYIAPRDALPTGCQQQGAEYGPAINCILDPQKYDCNKVADNQPCNYDSANRPTDLPITHIVIHDVEGSALSALATFQDPTFAVSAHYIIDTDGTVYQAVRHEDIAFQAGNFWYNQHSIGIEHAGYDKDGYLWYNAAEYLASAKLVAFLIEKYHIPFDHDHIVSHGTIPSPNLQVAPNHVDPGPYWLWEYYAKLTLGELFSPLAKRTRQGFVTLIPPSGRRPLGPHGTETKDNFNFFYLYTEPSTKSDLIPHQPDKPTEWNETDTVESLISYYYTDKKPDEAGSGMMMYKIWYGTEDQASTQGPQGQYAHAKEAWLAAPRDGVLEGFGLGQPVVLHQNNASVLPIYGRPAATEQDWKGDQIGEAPDKAVFISAYTDREVASDGSQTLWYEINFNHRQAWVLANEVTTL